MATSSSNASLVASTSRMNSTESLKDEEKKTILSFSQVIGYAVGHIHNDICAALWFTYLLVFFESVLQFDPKISGFLLLVGQIADGIATPIVGLESDRNTGDSFKYGKRKTWHLIGTVLSACSFPMVFQQCYGGEKASTKSLVFYYSMLIIIFQFAWASIQINHMSMATDLTPYSNERVKLTARRSCFTVISNIIVYLFTWYILHLDTNHSKNDQFSPDDASNFRTIVISLVGVGLIFSFIFHILVSEKPHNVQLKKDNQVDYSDRANHLKWHHWFKFVIFYQVAGLYMVSRLIVNLTQVFIPLYLHYSLDLNKESTAYIPLTIYCSGFFGSIIVELLSKKLSNVKILLCGSLISIISFISIYYGQSENFITKYIYFISILIGLSNQVININSQSILNDMIGQNTASSAFVFGAMSFLDKFSNGFAVMLIQLIRSSSSSFDKSFYRYVLSFVCGSSSILALLILCTILPHNFETDLRRNSLDNRNSNQNFNQINDENTNSNEQEVVKKDISQNTSITQEDKQLYSFI